MKNIFILESKQFLRNRITLLGFGILLLLGIYAIYHGHNVIQQQKTTIAKLDAVQQEQLEENIEHHEDHEIGTLCYYQFYYTSNEPTNWAAFSIGQRDVNPYTLKVRMLAVEGQLYDTELSNPVSLVTGNLDLSFVFIFLLPLLIITLTFNLLSGEEESGIWRLVASQPISTFKILLLKFSVRYLAVFILVILLMMIAVLALSLSLDQALLSILGWLLFYMSFWFIVVFGIVLLAKNSNFNAVSLLSIWLFMVILIPAFANVVISNSIPLPEALSTTVTQREAYHEKWDMPKNTVMVPFYEAYPQYSNYIIPEDRFTYGWYYAMMYSADKEAEQSSEILFEKLQKRHAAGKSLGYFLPSLLLQNKFNEVAKTDLNDHIDYLKAVKKFHRSISEFFYPHVFELSLPRDIDWQKLPKFEK
jgi:ABC-2 type transport system permease protein